jgi:glycerol transport system ATP-binding protein
MGIVVEHISKSYEGKKILDDISFEVSDGEFVTFLAPTGEGKTTLLRILAGVEKPDSGRIFYNGKDYTEVPVQKRNVAMVYQWFVNYPSMKVYDNIASPLRVSPKKPSKADIDKKVREIAALLKIDSLLDHLPSEISGGQQQRLAIARALAKDADYIFLDEPLTNLDYKLQEELRVELKSILTTDRQGAILFATPQPIEALALATYVGFLHRGRLMQFGPVDQVYRNPAYMQVGAYFSHPGMNIFECRVVSEGNRRWLRASDQLKIPVGDLEETLSKDHYMLGMRAHAISTEQTEADMIPISARVELGEVVGSDTELHLSHESISLVALLLGVGHYELGQVITAYLPTKRFFIFDKETGKLVAKTHVDE